MIATSLIASGLAAPAAELPKELEGYDPSGHIRFATLEEAEAHREKLIRYFWPEGLPTQALPKITADIDFPADLLVERRGKKPRKPVNRDLVASVDRLDFTIRVPDPKKPETGDWSMPSVGYWLKPKEPAEPARLAIFHTGHQRDLGLDPGNAAMVDALLERGIHVIQLDMPMYGRNNTKAGRTLTRPDGSTIVLGGGAEHNQLFGKFAGELDGKLFAFFVEPVVQSINLFNKAHEAQDITMIGKSGGGWTAHVVAAVDTRIDLSLAVAGAYPMYARKFAGRGSLGDAEQIYEPLFKEDDTDGDGVTDTAAGVASWLEIFALGALGKGRRQIQIQNFYDSCCFDGPYFETYDDFVAGVVDQLGTGQWEHHSDTTHKQHIISDDVRENVILPAIRESGQQANQDTGKARQ